VHALRIAKRKIIGTNIMRYRNLTFVMPKLAFYRHMILKALLLTDVETIISCNNPKYQPSTNLLRDVQISIFLELLQVPNRYMKFIGFGRLLSNHGSEKMRLYDKKGQIHRLGLTPLSCDLNLISQEI
jgi:hypothetical protein